MFDRNLSLMARTTLLTIFFSLVSLNATPTNGQIAFAKGYVKLTEKDCTSYKTSAGYYVEMSKSDKPDTWKWEKEVKKVAQEKFPLATSISVMARRMPVLLIYKAEYWPSMETKCKQQSYIAGFGKTREDAEAAIRSDLRSYFPSYTILTPFKEFRYPLGEVK